METSLPPSSHTNGLTYEEMSSPCSDSSRILRDPHAECLYKKLKSLIHVPVSSSTPPFSPSFALRCCFWISPRLRSHPLSLTPSLFVSSHREHLGWVCRSLLFLPMLFLQRSVGLFLHSSVSSCSLINLLSILFFCFYFLRAFLS
jgi:hypothetical protein